MIDSHMDIDSVSRKGYEIFSYQYGGSRRVDSAIFVVFLLLIVLYMV